MAMVVRQERDEGVDSLAVVAVGFQLQAAEVDRTLAIAEGFARNARSFSEGFAAGACVALEPRDALEDGAPFGGSLNRRQERLELPRCG
jgi:hypothetical protein